MLHNHLQNLPENVLTERYKRFRQIDRTKKLYKDLLQYVFSYLDVVSELPQLREVCKWWSNIATEVPNIFTNKVSFLHLFKNNRCTTQIWSRK